MQSPLISVIIPVFNSEVNLEKTIISALDQTWPNKEIIIVDDGSTDSSPSIEKKYEGVHVKVFQQKNKGASVARNRGLEEAKGNYIQFLDADDLLSPNKLQSQMALLLQHPDKIAVCRTVHFFNDENYEQASTSAYEDSFLYSTDNTAGFLSNLYGGESNRGSMIQTNAWLTPVDVIRKAGKWSEFYSPDDDGEFFCRVILASKGILYDKNCFNYYRKYKNSNNLASSKSKKALHGKFRSFLLKKQYLLNATDDATAKKALARSAMEIAFDAYPIDKKLTSEILKAIDEIGGTDYVPPMGGRHIELIKKLFGWKTARMFQIYYANLFRSKVKS